MSFKPGFIDVNVGRFPVVFFYMSIALLIISIFEYENASVARAVSMLYEVLVSVNEQFMVVVEGRDNIIRSMAVILFDVMAGLFGFVIFIVLVPAGYVRDSFCKKNFLLNSMLLCLSSLLFFMAIVVFIYFTYEVGSSNGKFARVLQPLVALDFGFGLLLLMLIAMWVYCSAVTVKAVFIKATDIK